MTEQIVKYIECLGNYDELSYGNEVYRVPIYAIPLNKKGFCKPFVQMETKDGIKNVPICSDYFRSKTCSKCVKEAKKLFKGNH